VLQSVGLALVVVVVLSPPVVLEPVVVVEPLGEQSQVELSVELSVGLSVGDEVVESLVTGVVLELSSGPVAGVVDPVVVAGGLVEVVGGWVALVLGDAAGSVVVEGEPTGPATVRVVWIGRGELGGGSLESVLELVARGTRADTAAVRGTSPSWVAVGAAEALACTCEPAWKGTTAVELPGSPRYGAGST
jgi:hypothetical protein